MQTHILFQPHFGPVSLVHFQALMMKKLRCKYYNKCITTRDDVNVQSPNQEESKLNSTINANIGAHAHVKIIKNPFSKNKISYY